MADQPQILTQTPGFKSPLAKQWYMIFAALLSMAFLTLQLVLGDFRVPRLETVQAETAVRWRGDIWYVATEATPFPGAQNPSLSKRLVHVSQDDRVTACSIAPGPAWLLPQGELLWIFSSDGVAQFDGKEPRQLTAEKMPEGASKPFLLNGQPATAWKENEKISLRSLENNRWVSKGSVSVDGADSDACAIAVGESIFIFAKKGATLYARTGIEDEKKFPHEWEKVGEVGDRWSVAAYDGKPAVVTSIAKPDAFPADVIAYVREEKGWTRNFENTVPLQPGSLGVALSADGVGISIVHQALMVTWSLNVIDISGGKTASKRYGGLRVPGGPGIDIFLLSIAVLAALSISAAFGFSKLMEKWRDGIFFTPGMPPVRLASLARRAIALLMDALIVAGPVLAAVVMGFLYALRMEDQPDRRIEVAATLLLFGGIIWGAILFLFLCAALGRWGRTPGKWAMGIRVIGTDMMPCGFPRALLRTLLLAIDLFPQLTFGLIIIVFSLNWQRLGDYAARTIVIRE